jgi:hypothetical protein
MNMRNNIIAKKLDVMQHVAKTQINKNIITGFINEKHMHGAIIEIYVFFTAQ